MSPGAGDRSAARPDPRRALGTRGEMAVARWYEDQGYQVIERNWRCREGELDLVLERGRVVVFCEVKTRTGDAFGVPAEAVTPTKQRRIRGLALLWLNERRDQDDSSGYPELRFDVASVTFPRGETAIDVIEAAF